MGISIRCTMTRPNTSTVWPFIQFLDDLTANFYALVICDSYFKGNQETDLEVVVDHYFTTEEAFNLNKDEIYAKLPLWQTDANKASNEAYMASSGCTVTYTEVTDPDLSEYVPMNLA